MKGKISQWHDDKGFGFIVSDDGDEKVFFHISSLKTSSRRPQVGDSVVYESTWTPNSVYKPKLWSSKDWLSRLIHNENHRLSRKPHPEKTRWITC